MVPVIKTNAYSEKKFCTAAQRNWVGNLIKNKQKKREKKWEKEKRSVFILCMGVGKKDYSKSAKIITGKLYRSGHSASVQSRHYRPFFSWIETEYFSL